ncbi:hypothetical protein JTB14_030306 [Gonioctena quinquepunctata]|nr:hypothetical protein JTB14_030306 [Gonioctena quinquepunctata]
MGSVNFLIFFTFISSPVLGTLKLQEHFQWNIIDYEYPTEDARTKAILTGRFKPENNLPVGIEIWNDKMFVSVPRWKEGIPATLNYIPLNSPVKNPRLIPFPDWSSNELGNCEKALKNNATDYGYWTQRLRRYELRPEDTNANTFIANIAVDLGSNCDDAYAYLSDELGYGLITYSFRENKSWRFTHSYFMPDPLRGDYTIDNLNFQWGEEGIFGMSLTPLKADGYRLLYFSPLASHREFVVSTQTLRNSSKVEDGWFDFYALAERGPNSHTTSRVMDNNGIQFFNLIDQNAIGCWNSAKEYNSENHGIVDKDDNQLIFPADVKVDRNGNIWVISDRMSNFLMASLDYNDVNFRVFFAPIDLLVKGTICECEKPVEYNSISNYQHFDGRTPQQYLLPHGENFVF